MYAFLTLPAIVGFFIASTGALPHDQMVNNEFERDVGVLYSGSNFTGEPLFLVQHKEGTKCESGIDNFNIASVQICIPATCIFYKNVNCTVSDPAFDKFLEGPLDVDDHDALHAIGSYLCGENEEMGFKTAEVAFAAAAAGMRH